MLIHNILHVTHMWICNYALEITFGLERTNQKTPWLSENNLKRTVAVLYMSTYLYICSYMCKASHMSHMICVFVYCTAREWLLSRLSSARQFCCLRCPLAARLVIGRRAVCPFFRLPSLVLPRFRIRSSVSCPPGKSTFGTGKSGKLHRLADNLSKNYENSNSGYKKL